MVGDRGYSGTTQSKCTHHPAGEGACHGVGEVKADLEGLGICLTIKRKRWFQKKEQAVQHTEARKKITFNRLQIVWRVWGVGGEES